MNTTFKKIVLKKFQNMKQTKSPTWSRLLALLILLISTNVNAQTLLQWNTFGNAGTETTEASTTNDANISAASLNFTGSSSSNQTIVIPVNDDNLAEQDEYFVISLENLIGAQLIGNSYFTVYIKDNDRKSPAPTKAVELNHITSFQPDATASSTCEIVVHDASSQRIFTTSAILP